MPTSRVADRRVLYLVAALALVWFAAREVGRHTTGDDRLRAAEDRADSSAIYAATIQGLHEADSARYAKEREQHEDSIAVLIARVDRAEKRRPQMQAAVVERHTEGQDSAVKAIVAAAVAEAVDSVVVNEVMPLLEARALDRRTIAAQQLELVNDDYLIGQINNALRDAREEARLRELAANRGGIRASHALSFLGGALVAVGTIVVLVLR